MLSFLRPSLQPIYRALGAPFIALHIHPQWVSLLGLPFGLACAYAYATQRWVLALLLFPLTVLWDAIDGSVARAQGKESNWGNYLETMIDRGVDIMVFVGLAFVAPIASIVALGCGLLASYAKPRVALVIITDNRDWPAVGEHADKTVILLAGTLLAAIIPSQAVAILTYTLWAIAIIGFIGTLQRMQHAKRLIAEAEKNGTLLPYLNKGKAK
jgi:phosphatidylglycerophosphate synthase